LWLLFLYKVSSQGVYCLEAVGVLIGLIRVFCFPKTSRSSTALSSTVAARPATRFDRLKASWKGPKTAIDDTDELDFTYQEFEQAVATTEYSFGRNMVVSGMAVEYGPNGCLVDIGAKSSAFLPLQEAGLVLPEPMNWESVLPLDTATDFTIISEEDENGQLLVSIKRLQFQKAWEKVKKLAEEDAVVMAEVIGVNRGGAICLLDGIRAFLPGSHLSGMLPDDDLIGQKLPLKFLEIIPESGKIVMSHRKAVVERQMADLSRGDLVEGIVKAIKPYGAFVEVGGMSGLLHISQISYDRIDNLEVVLQPGMKVKCMIIDHDKVNGRIALSTKTLELQPGDMLKDAANVFANAEENAAKYHAKMEHERQQRESTARGIVMGLGDITDDETDPLQEVSDSLESLLS
jgi:small subunit ribosomal protein S1